MASTKNKEVGPRMSEPETLDLFGSMTIKTEIKPKETTVSSRKTTTSTQTIAQKNAKEMSEVVSPSKEENKIDVSQPVKITQTKSSEPRSSRRKGPEKSDDAFKTISEVASQMSVPQHVLRFWETKFSQIKPMKRGGGRRYYRPRDVEIIKRIQYLLHNEGYTIKGVQKLAKKLPLVEFLSENSHKNDVSSVENTVARPAKTNAGTNLGEPLAVILEGLKAIRKELNS